MNRTSGLGPVRPDRPAIERFWNSVPGTIRGPLPASRVQVRWIGLDHDSTEQVLALIESGDKTGTFTLPWIVSRTGQSSPQAGDLIILIDFHGRPRLLVRLTGVDEVTFGAMDERHTAVDGTPVRELGVWKPLHTRYWNAMLEPFGLHVSDDMPVLVEKFELLDHGAD